MVALQRTDDSPTDDQVVVLYNLTWQDYRRLIEARGDRSGPRMTYLNGTLELMSPSFMHETLKSTIGCLVEVYCEITGIEWVKAGSWTLEDEAVERAVEPDECYIFGSGDRDRPDLAIEVVWTRGGVNKLDVYRLLGVREVWFWRLGKLTVHALRGDTYEAVARSEVLEGIDLELLASFLDRPKTSQAVREYRAALRDSSK